jgi:hypothetical protein
VGYLIRKGVFFRRFEMEIPGTATRIIIEWLPVTEHLMLCYPDGSIEVLTELTIGVFGAA